MLDRLDVARRREPLVAHPWCDGRELYLVELSASEAMAAADDPKRFALWMVAYGLRDAEGRRVISDDEIERLAETPFRLLAPIAERVQAISGLSAAARDATEKN